RIQRTRTGGRRYSVRVKLLEPRARVLNKIADRPQQNTVVKYPRTDPDHVLAPFTRVPGDTESRTEIVAVLNRGLPLISHPKTDVEIRPNPHVIVKKDSAVRVLHVGSRAEILPKPRHIVRRVVICVAKVERARPVTQCIRPRIDRLNIEPALYRVPARNIGHRVLHLIPHLITPVGKELQAARGRVPRD